MHTLEQFADSGISLVILREGQEIFRSQASGLAPLVEYLAMGQEQRDNLTIFDKYVGRAAALLMTLLNPVKVYAGVISEGGAETLEQFLVPYEAGKTVRYLMEVASESMCRWEKVSIGKAPDEFLEEVRKTGSETR
jgi:hypothetical protein